MKTNIALSHFFLQRNIVVSTVVSGILFARFPTVKSGGKSHFLFHFFLLQFNDVRRKLYTVRIHSTVGKRSKGMPDTTVETTNIR